MVVSIFECPSSRWIERMLQPCSSRCVANEWRSWCGCISIFNDSRNSRLIRWRIVSVLIYPSCEPFRRGLNNLPLSWPAPYSRSSFAKRSEINVIRCLPPLPTTLRQLPLKCYTSTFISSSIRSPASNIKEIIRASWRVRQCFTTYCICPNSITSGCFSDSRHGLISVVRKSSFTCSRLHVQFIHDLIMARLVFIVPTDIGAPRLDTRELIVMWYSSM